MCDTQAKHFSTAQIAAAMAVGESSVKRWIDAGNLAAEKTPGGHRRVALADFYTFLRASGRKLVAPEAVGLGTSAKAVSESAFEVCRASLQTGDAFVFESALRLLQLSDSTPAVTMDKTVYPAFQAVRATCQHPSEECLVLHRAISITQHALKATILASGETARRGKVPKIVFADNGYEVDGIPTLFAEASVFDQADCLQLGTNVPATVIVGALEAFDADILWLSACGPGRRSAIQADFQTILAKAIEANVRVVAFGDAVPRKLGGTATVVGSFSEFRGFVAALAG